VEGQLAGFRASLPAIVVLALMGCASGSRDAVDLGRVCTSLGMAPGTDAFIDCVEQQKLQQENDVQQIRQTRESLRGSSKL
jgi:hypothetical protein